MTRPTQVEVLTALLPTWADSIDPGTGRVEINPRTGRPRRIMLASSYTDHHLTKVLLPGHDADEVIAVAEELVAIGRLQAYNTHAVGNLPPGRTYFYRDFHARPPEWAG